VAPVPDSLQGHAVFKLVNSHARRAAPLALLAGVLACGGKTDSDVAPGPSPPPVYIPSSPATPARPAPAPTVAAPATPPPSVPQEPESSSSTQEDFVENILGSNCGSCHGPAAPVAASGGIRFIDDVDQLVEAGLILPLQSVQSPIVRVIARGSMPPPGSDVPQMSEPDLDVIISYIDNPRFWPDVPTTPGRAQDGGIEPATLDGG
jgi:mono/diheme cytochrome c family protein